MSARITVAQLLGRIDAQDARIGALVEAQTVQTELLGKLVAQMSAYATPAPVVAITEAKSAKTRTRKSTPAKKAAPKKAAPTVVTTEQAQALVDAGENPWKVYVASNTTGQPIPFGKVQRAIRAQERANTPKTERPTVKPTKAVKALGTNASVYFAMSKSQLVADGSKGAQAELERRAAKKAAKSA